MENMYLNYLFIGSFLCFTIIVAENPWREWGHKRYFSDMLDLNPRLKYTEASLYCQNLSSHLTSVHSQEETAFLLDNSAILELAWIGLHHSQPSLTTDCGCQSCPDTDDVPSLQCETCASCRGADNWQWEDRTQYDWTNWNNDQPSDFKNEKCVRLHGDGKWYDDSCSTKHFFICTKGSICANSIKDLVFVLDSSGSVCNNENITTCENWEGMLQFVKEVIDQLAIGDGETHVGIVVFGSKAESTLFLNNGLNRVELKNFVTELAYVPFQSTNTSGGLYKVIKEQFIPNNGDRKRAENELIIITDGVSTIDIDLLYYYVSELLNAGVKMFSIGVTNNIDENELRLMSSPPRVLNKNYFIAQTFDVLIEIVKTWSNQSCGDDKISCYPHFCNSNGICVSNTCVCNSGFTGKTCDTATTTTSEMTSTPDPTTDVSHLSSTTEQLPCNCHDTLCSTTAQTGALVAVGVLFGISLIINIIIGSWHVISLRSKPSSREPNQDLHVYYNSVAESDKGIQKTESVTDQNYVNQTQIQSVGTPATKVAATEGQYEPLSNSTTAYGNTNQMNTYAQLQ